MFRKLFATAVLAAVTLAFTSTTQAQVTDQETFRVTVNSSDAASAVPAIVDALARQGYSTPVVGDFHFNGHKLLANNMECAQALCML